jgi:hypothetical protein
VDDGSHGGGTDEALLKAAWYGVDGIWTGVLGSIWAREANASLFSSSRSRGPTPAGV